MSWKLGASTLGSPGEQLEQVIDTLRSAGVAWVELRAAPDALVSTDLSAVERALIRRRLESSGMGALAVASGVRVCRPGADEEVVCELIDHLRLAADLGAGFVRVFPGLPIRDAPFDTVPAALVDRGAAETKAAWRLSEAVRRSAALGVCLALETHDSHPRGADVARILERVDEEARLRTGVIWDLLHPWRVGEAPASTWQALGSFLSEGRGYVQIKDVASRTDLAPVLQGEGVLPLAEALSVLRAGGYTGTLSLEWERTWYPDAVPLSQALPAARAAVVAAEQHLAASGAQSQPSHTR